RLTVKLKPVASAPVPPVTIPEAAPAQEVAASKEEDDTRTRGTIKLKPVLSAAPAVPVINADKAAAPAEPAKAAEPDTRTRNTVKLKPMGAVQAASPVSLKDGDAPAPAAVESADDDRTVRIQRPVLKKPMPRPAMSKPAPPAPVAAAVPPAPAPAPVPAESSPVQEAIPEAPAPEAAPESVVEPVRKNNDAAAAIQFPEESESRPSVLYTVLTLITFVLLACAATLGVVHYLNFEHKKDIKISGIPFGK
ncbi:MAG: hypothetical protein J6W00_11805, partial [Lentisphaeria bacterium]|nr:hypothetical protein [Lentisphaeria bacterium]